MKAIILMACLLLFSGKLWASCSATPAMPQSWDLSSIAVTSSLPPGSDIPGSQHTFSLSGTCGASGSDEVAGDPIIACYYGTGTEIAGFPGVYTTGVEGIGIALTNSSGQRVIGASQNCDTRNTSLGALDTNKSYQISVTLSLVKTANDISDTALQQSQTRFGLGVYGKSGLGSGGGTNTLSYTGNILIRTESCDVLNKTIDVQLGTVWPGLFSGTTAGGVTPDVPFSIELNCDAGANVNIRIDGTADDSLAAGVIKISSGTEGQASGVGIQILKGDTTPVSLGQQWAITPSASEGNLSIPFFARYYLNGQTLSSGSANGTATFTMIYY
ncbi:fimbrial protein [Rahnella aquatilis]|uniref:fimbrial protein n=1 Tax=Rahnella aquatilis TaxID=34038 RepID=UPI003652BFDD